MIRRVVLAYSGGLGSTVALGLLAPQADVLAVVVDFGTGDVDLGAIRRRAFECGAADVVEVEARDELADGYCLPALQANAVVLGCYPLVASLARPVLAGHLVAVAENHAASAVAHGGDGVLTTTVADLAPGLDVLEPVTDRDDAVRYARERCLPVGGPQVSTKRTLWGRDVDAPVLVDLSRAPGAVFSYVEDAAVNFDAPDEVVVTFERGVPVALDGETVSVAEAVQRLGHRAGGYGFGRFDLDLAGGGRESYEAPGAAALLTAHRELEAVTLDRDLARFKRGIDRRWTELVQDGSWFSPLREPLDAFVRQAQERVSGEVRLALHTGTVAGERGVPGRRARPAGRRYRPVTGQTPLGSAQHPTPQAS
ncbi:argininosuccinate synthase [Amycolatopsis ultiminotia]|uniref:argininosuccinate synthase n=1 Tax=Amycolatopsis ultiminotia TaxID=543629 RepID=A0ABP6YGL2_9PSEU